MSPHSTSSKALGHLEGDGVDPGIPIKQAVFANFTPDKNYTSLLSDSLPRPLLSCHSPFLYLHSSSLAALSTRLLIPITSQTQVTQLCL